MKRKSPTQRNAMTYKKASAKDTLFRFPFRTADLPPLPPQKDSFFISFGTKTDEPRRQNHAAIESYSRSSTFRIAFCGRRLRCGVKAWQKLAWGPGGLRLASASCFFFQSNVQISMPSPTDLHTHPQRTGSSVLHLRRAHT